MTHNLLADYVLNRMIEEGNRKAARELIENRLELGVCVGCGEADGLHYHDEDEREYYLCETCEYL